MSASRSSCTCGAMATPGATMNVSLTTSRGYESAPLAVGAPPPSPGSGTLARRPAQALREPLGGERGGDLVPPAEGFEMRLERPREPVEVEPGRAQQLRQLAHLAEGLGDQASRLARPRAELAQVGRELPLEQPEVRGHRGERLPELVVQLAREPAELLLLHGDEARGERGELVLALDQARSEATQDARAGDRERGADSDPAEGAHERRHWETPLAELGAHEREAGADEDADQGRAARAPGEEDSPGDEQGGEGADRKSV